MGAGAPARYAVTGGIAKAILPPLPVRDTPVTRLRGIVGRCSLWESQRLFMLAPHRHVLFSSGSGGGKTMVAAYKFLVKALGIPGGLGLVVSKDRAMLKAVQFRMVCDFLDFWAVVNKMSFILLRSEYEGRIVLINGFEIRFKPADDADKFVGTNADLVWIDEASVLDDQINLWQKLEARLRGSRHGAVPQMIVTTTPKGPFGIVGLFAQRCIAEIRKDRLYMDRTPQDKAAAEGWCLIYGSVRENELWDNSYIDAVGGTMSSELRKQEQEGRIVQVSGAVYARHYHHLYSVIDFRPDWSRHEAHACIDWGINKPYAAIIAHDPHARAKVSAGPEDVIVDEYVDDRVSGHRSVIAWCKEAQKRWGIAHFACLYPDPAGRKENVALRQEFPGIRVLTYEKTDDRETRWGVDLVQSRLLSDDGLRHLFVSRELANRPHSVDPRGRGAHRMFLGLRWEERRGVENIFRDRVLDDEHLINCGDAIRYYVTWQYRDIGRGFHLV